MKILSYYKVIDREFFRKSGVNEKILSISDKTPYYWIIAWIHKNPDNTTSVGHTLIDDGNYQQIVTMTENDLNADSKFLPGYKISDTVLSEDEYRNSSNLWFITDKICNSPP